MMYIAFIILGLIVNFVINYYQLRENKINKKDIIKINVIQIIFLVLGSKILDTLVNYGYYTYYNIFQVITSGYMFYGGMILSIFYLYAYCKIKHIDLVIVFKIILPNILLLYAIWKMGCFFNKCCVGINGFPIQIVESIICIIAYCIISKRSKALSKIYLTCIIFGLMRIFAFLLRKDINMQNLIVNEMISSAILLAGVIIFCYNKKLNKKHSND